jgi:hypothetical protein
MVFLPQLVAWLLCKTLLRAHDAVAAGDTSARGDGGPSRRARRIAMATRETKAPSAGVPRNSYWTTPRTAMCNASTGALCRPRRSVASRGRRDARCERAWWQGAKPRRQHSRTAIARHAQPSAASPAILGPRCGSLACAFLSASLRVRRVDFTRGPSQRSLPQWKQRCWRAPAPACTLLLRHAAFGVVASRPFSAVPGAERRRGRAKQRPHGTREKILSFESPSLANALAPQRDIAVEAPLPT